MAIQFEFYKNPQPEKKGKNLVITHGWLIFNM